MIKQKKNQIKKRLAIAINITMFMFFLSVFFKVSFVRELKSYFDFVLARKDIFLVEFYDLSSLAAMINRLDILNEVFPLVEIFYVGILFALYTYVFFEIASFFTGKVSSKKVQIKSRHNHQIKTNEIYLENLRFLC
ncbi:MAG: hypothetical protein ACOX6H_03920 [Christensenellales bacterium]|jgi:hypothetical protein